MEGVRERCVSVVYLRALNETLFFWIHNPFPDSPCVPPAARARAAAGQSTQSTSRRADRCYAESVLQ
jgi:hypothetical protein